MAEYIERNKVLEMSYCPTTLTQDNPLADSKAVVDVEDIESIPTADVEEVKHGKWIETKEWYFDEYAQSEYQRKCYECSRCKRTELYEEPYCHCGAKMDGGDINEDSTQ